LEQFGEVISTGYGIAVVKIRRHSACSQCGRCGMSMTGEGPVDSLVEVRNPLGARAGQTVKITMKSGRLLLIAFVVYFLPALLLVTGIYGGQKAASVLFAFQGRPAEITGLCLGVFLMVASFISARGWDRRVAASPAYKPIITEVIK